jgi:hypothetical protein
MFSSGAWSIPARSLAEPVARSIGVVLLMKGGRETKKRDGVCLGICGAYVGSSDLSFGIMWRGGL